MMITLYYYFYSLWKSIYDHNHSDILNGSGTKNIPLYNDLHVHRLDTIA